MKNGICNLTGSRSDACPMVGANCHGSESDSKSRGYVGGGKALATVRLYTQVYEFKPLSEEVTTLCLSALRLIDWNMCGVIGGGLYRVRKTPLALSYTGFNVS